MILAAANQSVRQSTRFAFCFCPQASGSMVPVRLDLRETRGGELGRHGVQYSDTVLHADVRDHEHRLL